MLYILYIHFFNYENSIKDNHDLDEDFDISKQKLEDDCLTEENMSNKLENNQNQKNLDDQNDRLESNDKHLKDDKFSTNRRQRSNSLQKERRKLIFPRTFLPEK